MKRINNLSVALILTAALAGCLTSRKVDKQVAKQYGSLPDIKKKKPGDKISIVSSLVSNNGPVSTTETRTSHMLPLIVYWQWDYKNTCTINPQIPINNFAATVLSYANRGLKAKLGDRDIELSVDQVPNKFAIDDKAHLIFFGYAFGWDNVSIKAVNMEMIVSYKVFKDNAEIKKGVITLPGFNDKNPLGMFKSWKKATGEYLDQYDENIQALAKQVVDRLMTEL